MLFVSDTKLILKITSSLKVVVPGTKFKNLTLDVKIPIVFHIQIGQFKKIEIRAFRQ